MQVILIKLIAKAIYHQSMAPGGGGGSDPLVIAIQGRGGLDAG